MQHIVDLMEIVGGRVDSLAKSDVVVGDPMVFGELTIVPLSRVAMGFGVGGGEGEGETDGPQGRRRRNKGHIKGKGRGAGGASGVGAKVRPVAVVVFSPDGVEVLPIPSKMGLLDKLFDKVPDVIEMVKKATAGDSDDVDE